MMEQSLFGQTVLTPNSGAANYASPALGHPHHLQGPAGAAAGASATTGLKREFPDDQHQHVDRHSHQRHRLDGAGIRAAAVNVVSPVDREDESASPSDTPAKKQKRNKPTLSCFECVERKTKVGLPFELHFNWR